jgi:hypothetical protein
LQSRRIGVHYTTAAHLGSILRDGRIEATRHEGYKKPMVSFVEGEDAVPSFYWYSPNGDWTVVRGLARVTFEFDDAKDWESTCRSKMLVKITKTVEDVSRWRVLGRDVPASDFVRVEMLIGGEWVCVDLGVVETMLKGRKYTIYRSIEKTVRELVY